MTTTTTTTSSTGSSMATAPGTSAPEVATRALTRLEDAWNAGDGTAFGAAYQPGASFVTIQGQHVDGAEAIGAGHAGIFATIYAGSVNSMELVSAREVADGVVVAVSRNTLQAPTGPLAGTHRALSTSVLVRGTDGSWSIAATHNTLVAG